jgi:hypothetical protein
MQSYYNKEEAEVISRPSSTALLVLDSADRVYYDPLGLSGGNPVIGSQYTRTGKIDQPYNNFRIQKAQALLQGGFTRIAVTEVCFPYNIPNVNDYTNTFWVTFYAAGAASREKITIANGYYDGAALATAVAAALNAAYAGYTWTVDFNASNGFDISCVLTAGSVPQQFSLFNFDPLTNASNIVNTGLLDVMGFNPASNYYYCAFGGVAPSFKLSSVGASLQYTKYIDIVSSKLTYYQNVSDSSSRRTGGSNVICRLYISNNLALASAFSPLPYVIERQFTYPKQVKWDKDTQIDWVDIQLLDDSGRALYYNDQTLMSGDFMITLLASEN